MKQGCIIFQGKIRSDREIIIRYPKKGDADIMRDYINELSRERTYIRFQGEQITLKDEEKFLKSLLEKISKKEALLLMVFYKDELIGVADIRMQDKIEKHIGIMGITVAKKYRNEGIGTLLLKQIINEGVKYIPNLEIISLGVFANNRLALNLYKKFGFVEYGRLSRGIKLEAKYVDHVNLFMDMKK